MVSVDCGATGGKFRTHDQLSAPITISPVNKVFLAYRIPCLLRGLVFNALLRLQVNNKFQ